MSPLAAHLLRKNPRLSGTYCETMARRIIAEKSKRAARKKAELAAANPELPFDAPSPTLPDDPTVDF